MKTIIVLIPIKETIFLLIYCYITKIGKRNYCLLKLQETKPHAIFTTFKKVNVQAVSFSKLIYLRYLYERITSTTIHQRYIRYTRHKYFHRGNHKGENPTNFLIIVSSQRQDHKMNNPRTICILNLSLFLLISISLLMHT